MRATSEYERKLDAPVGFRLPPLGGRPLEPRVFTSVYYDVPGGSLASAGTTAEVTVDEVAVMDARRVRDRFVEVELELRAGSPAQLDVLADEVAGAGAEPGSGRPKVFRALGRDRGQPVSPQSPFDALERL